MIKGTEIGNLRLGRKSIKYSLVESSSYLHCVNQCLSNSKHSGSSKPPPDPQSNCGKLKWPRRDAHSSNKLVSEVYSWRTAAKFVHYAAVTYYSICVSKYLFVRLISPGSPLEAYRWMDCFIPGRFRFIGRTNRISDQIACFILFCMGIFRVSMVNFTQDFRFYACEFMLNDYKYVSSMKPVVRLCPTGTNAAPAAVPAKHKKRPTASTGRSRKVDSIFYVKNRFGLHRDEWILRPNRTPSSWLRVCRYTTFAAIGTLFVIVGWYTLLSYFLAGSILTDLGFEMSYPTCTRWLRDEQAIDSRRYSYIYVAPKVLASDRTIDELPARVSISTADLKTMSSYRIVLMLFDVAENLTTYTEFISFVCAIAHLLIINSIDIVANAMLIKSQLVQLIDQSEEFEGMRSTLTTRAQTLHGENRPQLVIAHRQLLDKITRMQAIILDHFKLTKTCNRFTSYFFAYLFSVWIGYTAVICTWVGAVKSRTVEFEFVIAQLLAAVFVIALLSTAAIVRTYNFQLYPLMVQIMSRRSNDIETSIRWASFMNFFYPRPYYCMVLFDNLELSWLFNLKVSQEP
jgi:hypothetical protein